MNISGKNNYKSSNLNKMSKNNLNINKINNVQQKKQIIYNDI